MAKLRNPLPFPFASAREKRAHQIRTELQPSIGGSKGDHSYASINNAGHSRFYGSPCIEQDIDAGSSANEAFFGDYKGGRLTQPDGVGGRGKTRKKTPAMRLKKKAKSLDLDVLDGLITPPTRPRMRIRSLNTKRQTSPSEDDLVPPQPHLTVDLRLALLFSAVYLVFLFMLYPSTMLDLTLMVLMFFAPFPVWMPWWTALLTMVLPMEVRARFEVTVFLCGVVWLGGLEWGTAWRRVGKWVREE